MDLNSTVAASRLIAQLRVMDVVAANIANANTPGFAERVQFSDWLSRQANTEAPKGGKVVTYTQDRATWRDTRDGVLTHTGNTFDLALAGDGYFIVNTPRGPRLTRDGRFGLMPNGTIADGSGNALLNTNGQPIQLALTDTDIHVAGDGTVSSQNGQLGKVGVVRPEDPMKLAAEGGTQFRADTATTPVARPGIVQGAIEDSNVQPVLEVTRMMDGLRQFEYVSQFIQAEADRQQNSIDKILPTQG